MGDQSGSVDGDAGSADGAAGTSVREREAREVSDRAGHGSLSRTETLRDAAVRRWDVVSPSATTIGRASDPASDVSESLRRLHEERHPAMRGHSSRIHRLDKLRVAHALCSHLDLTGWQRDRVLGVMEELDLTAFGSQRAVPKVALVVVRHVVDVERRRYLGLEDGEYLAGKSPDELADLYDAFRSIKDEPAFERLLDAHGLDKTSLNRLRNVLVERLDEQGIADRAFGRNPYRDPNLPALRDRGPDAEEEEEGNRAGKGEGNGNGNRDGNGSGSGSGTAEPDGGR
jgi:hypothetical protein